MCRPTPAPACLAAGLAPLGLGYSQHARSSPNLGQLTGGMLVLQGRGRRPRGGRRLPGGCVACDLMWLEASLSSVVKVRAVMAAGRGWGESLRALSADRRAGAWLRGAQPGLEFCSFPPV